MASKAFVKDKIFEFFQTGVDAAYPTNPPEIAYPNVKFSPTMETRWLSIIVLSGGAGQESLGSKGNRKYKRAGLITVMVMTPLYTGGTVESDTLSENIENIFEGEEIDLLDGSFCVFRNATTIDTGRDGEFYQALVNVELEYRVIK
ncbi:MAG: hypothetical protein COA47_10445 [Robiginitomaculum sp.]|nr:MAG: hypothetical protein COA47_10445 [Robiginitomaculum sp.]